MSRSNFKMRKSLGRGQKQNVPEILNNMQKESSLTTLPCLHFPSATLNLRQDVLKKSKKLPSIQIQKGRTSRSTQHLANTLKLVTTVSVPSSKLSLKQLTISLPSFELNQLENKKLVEQYGASQLKFLTSKDVPQQFFKRHNIKISIRAKMVDWMTEVLCSYKCFDKTFFQSVQIMDRYYHNVQKIEESRDLHLVGVCCMFMAIKLQQIIPLRLQTVYQRIGHKKLSMDSIKKKQQQIMSALDFNILVSTVYDVFTTTLQIWASETKVLQKDLEKIISFCSYIARMVVLQYELMSTFSKKMLAGSIIYLSFKIFKQLNSSFQVESQMQKIYTIAELSKDEIHCCAEKVLDLVKNFENYYPSLGNIKRFCKIEALNTKKSIFD